MAKSNIVQNGQLYPGALRVHSCECSAELSSHSCNIVGLMMDSLYQLKDKPELEIIVCYLLPTMHLRC